MAEGIRCDKVEIIYKTLIAFCALSIIYKLFYIGPAPTIVRIKDRKYSLLGPFYTTHITVEDKYTQLIDINNFTFKMNPQPCEGYPAGLLLMIIISSNPSNRENRMVIRNTWGRNLDWTKVVFLIGEPQDITVANQMKNESMLYGDIVQGNFVDVYRNLTYKHVMGLKWVAHHCPTAKYVLKTDDDVLVNSRELTHFLTRKLSPWGAKDLIACSLMPNTQPLRYNCKWKVSAEEYTASYYPDYCSGYAILYSQDVVHSLLKIAQSTPYFWIDDVYVTGVLAEKIGIPRTCLTSLLSDYQSINPSINQTVIGYSNREQIAAKKVVPFIIGPPNLEPGKIMDIWTSIFKRDADQELSYAEAIPR